MVKVDLSGAQPFFDAAGPDYAAAAEAHRLLASGSGAGHEFTGWRHLPRRMAETELKPIVRAARTIRSESEALLVVGTGGSYLGPGRPLSCCGAATTTSAPGSTRSISWATASPPTR